MGMMVVVEVKDIPSRYLSAAAPVVRAKTRPRKVEAAPVPVSLKWKKYPPLELGSPVRVRSNEVNSWPVLIPVGENVRLMSSASAPVMKAAPESMLDCSAAPLWLIQRPGATAVVAPSGCRKVR